MLLERFRTFTRPSRRPPLATERSGALAARDHISRIRTYQQTLIRAIGLTQLCLVFFATVVPASASPVNYMDESGNIFFADSIREVPAKYRSQLITPTPWPLDKRGRPIIPRKSAEQLRHEREKLRQENLKKREMERRRRDLERRQRDLQRLEKRTPQGLIKLQPEPEPLPVR